MTGEDTADEGESGLSRREMLGATAILGGASVLGTGTAGAETSRNGRARAEMQTTTEPRIALGDNYAIDDSPDGNGDFVIEHLPSGARFSYDSGIGAWTANSISVGGVEVKNESLVSAGLSSNQSISANTMTTLALDSTTKDEKGEFDTTTYQFTPKESGFYQVSIGANFAVGSSGDNLLVELQDVTAGSPLLRDQSDAPTTDYTQRSASKIVELTAGNNHEVLVRNQDSSDTILSGDFRSYLTVRSMFR